MKNYKDYNKTYIGSSDSAYLTLKTITGTTEKLCFGEDGSYSAYVVDEDTLIPKHYHKEFEFTDSLEIYNNFGELEWSAKAKQISVYTAGNFGCLIKLEGAENYKFDLKCRSDKDNSLTWKVIHYAEDENGNPSLWTAKISNKEYGKFAWIAKYDENYYGVEADNIKENRFEIVYRCNSFDEAKKWASENLIAENEFQNDENENDEEPEL